MNTPNLKFILSDPNAKIPTRATSKSSGLDLYALNNCLIPSKSVKVIDTGIKCIIPEGYEGQVRSRSGLACKNSLFVLNSPGTIDNDYRGEIKVIMCNLSDKDYEVKQYDRVAQFVLAPLILPTIEVIENNVIEKDNERGEGGFGSTGK